MAERTVTISSAGKTFNVTGWKIGWACGPAPLVAAVRAAKQFLTYVGGAPFQPAVAQALRDEMGWVAELRDSLQDKRDRLVRGSGRRGVRRVSAAGHLLRDGRHPAARRVRRDAVLPRPAGTGRRGRGAGRGVPRRPADGKPFVRFAFCKRDEVIDEAVDAGWRRCGDRRNRGHGPDRGAAGPRARSSTGTTTSPGRCASRWPTTWTPATSPSSSRRCTPTSRGCAPAASARSSSRSTCPAPWSAGPR